MLAWLFACLSVWRCNTLEVQIRASAGNFLKLKFVSVWQIGVSQMTVTTKRILMEIIVDIYAPYDDLTVVVIL